MKKREECEDLVGCDAWDGVWRERDVPGPVDPSLDTVEAHRDRQLHLLFEKVLAGMSGGDLLEVGCARSRWLPYFALTHGFRVSGLDYSETGCEQARAILRAAGVEGVVHGKDMFDCPELEGAFDVVVSFGLVEHFTDTAGALAALGAFLRPGGVLVTVVPHVRGLPGVLLRMINRESYGQHVPLPPARLEEATCQAGLEPIETRYFMTLNLSALSLALAQRPRAWWVGPVWTGFDAATMLASRLVRAAMPEMPNRLTSPYVVGVASRINPIGLRENRSSCMNPHFDQDRIVWKDEYSGLYEPPKYDEQFDLQWSLALKDQGWSENPGTSVSDEYIADRILEWTGERPGGGGYRDPTMGSRVMDHPLDPALIKGRKCLDLCCGVGRWTRVMQALGAASVLSTDISESALKGVSRFNSHTRRVNLMTLREEQPDMVGAFEFVNCWGVVMCTHDPREAFENAAATIAPGGSLFIMSYSPQGMHNTRLVNTQRRIFHSLPSVQERLAFVDKVWRRDWDWRYALKDNLRNLLRRALKEDRGYKIAYLDTLAPAYNWTVPFETIRNWMLEAGFETVVHLNEHEEHKCAHHVLGLKKKSQRD